jgi:hypothetical protein
MRCIGGMSTVSPTNDLNKNPGPGLARLADAADKKGRTSIILVNEVRQPRADVATVVASGSGAGLAATTTILRHDIDSANS